MLCIRALRTLCKVKSPYSNVTHREDNMKTRGYAPGFHIATAKRLAAMTLTALGSYSSETAKGTIKPALDGCHKVLEGISPL